MSGIIFLLSFYLMSLPAQLFANDLLQKIREDQFLLLGNVGNVDYMDDKYIISVGVSSISNSSPSLKRKAMIETKAKAYSQLSKFIHENEIKVIELFKTKETVTKINNSQNKDSKSEFVETIQEKNEGPLKMIENIGSWSTNEKFYWVTGIKIPQLPN